MVYIATCLVSGQSENGSLIVNTQYFASRADDQVTATTHLQLTRLFLIDKTYLDFFCNSDLTDKLELVVVSELICEDVTRVSRDLMSTTTSLRLVTQEICYCFTGTHL